MRRYDRGLHWVIGHQAVTLIVALATLVLTALLYLAIPKGLFPTQDTGQLQGRIQAAPEVSYARMSQLQQEAARTGTDAAGTPRYQLTTTALRPTGELDLWEHVVTAVYRMIGSALESVGILAFEIVSLDMRLEPTEVTA